MELSIIVPTFNERDNVEALVLAISKAIKEDTTWEIIFVDDNSPDGTYSCVNELAHNWSNVRCLRRVNRRGLSSASIEGMLASSADFFVLMDGDLQHDETIITKMLALIKEKNLDLVIASRFIGEGGAKGLTSTRLRISNFAASLSRMVLKIQLTDPMSGFFVVSRKFFEANVGNLSVIGFKILLDLIASSTTKPLFVEVPYQMRKRTRGSSKLTPIVVWEYLLLLIDKSLGRWLPVRFLMFLIVGFSGVLVHLLVLKSLLLLDYTFIVAQIGATITAMTTNYIFNNLFTYRDKKLSGLEFFRGLISFYMACSIGALINITLAAFLFNLGITWWLSGVLGAIIGSIWNYGATKYITWR